MKPSFQIVKAAPENAAALTEIACTAKRHWGYSERWIETWKAVLTITPTFILQHETYAAVAEGCTLGFYALCFEDQCRVRLEHLWVVPQCMRRGIGRTLFSHAVHVAREIGFRELVIESDPHAEGFYLRMGALRFDTKVTELEGQRREMPVLRYAII